MDRTFTEKPLDCKWSGWAKWSDCSQSCGKGSQTRERSIEMLARNGGSPCRGKGKQKRSCQIASCPSKLLSQIQKLSKYFTAPMRTIQQVRPVKYMLNCTKRTTCHSRKTSQTKYHKNLVFSISIFVLFAMAVCVAYFLTCCWPKIAKPIRIL